MTISTGRTFLFDPSVVDPSLERRGDGTAAGFTGGGAAAVAGAGNPGTACRSRLRWGHRWTHSLAAEEALTFTFMTKIVQLYRLSRQAFPSLDLPVTAGLF